MCCCFIFRTRGILTCYKAPSWCYLNMATFKLLQYFKRPPGVFLKWESSTCSIALWKYCKTRMSRIRRRHLLIFETWSISWRKLVYRTLSHDWNNLHFTWNNQYWVQFNVIILTPRQPVVINGGRRECCKNGGCAGEEHNLTIWLIAYSFH